MKDSTIKTKGEWLKQYQGDIALVIGFLLVALIAFGAGRLTAPEIVRNPVIINDSDAFSEEIVSPIKNIDNNEQGNEIKPVADQKQQGLFVGSRSGSKYHWPWCSYAQKIKEENKVWFKDEAEAQAAGYSPCSCIQSKMPAGYKAK